MSEAIKSRIRGFAVEVEAFQRELYRIKNPPRTLLQNVIEEGVKDLVPKTSGEVAGKILRSFRLPGNLASKYTRKAVKERIKRN